ncbi:MAG TPA: hypothetical protein PK544_01080 [Spirochaetota bacterium]|nr:hypothetical protein [Spirochaetota bacterium]HPQ52733.1 hypothetical protein [Spirochaetota bacterium]
MKYIKIYVLLIAVVFSCLAGCSDVADEIKVRIISNGANFTGWYDVDGDIHYITGGAATSNVYALELTLEDIEDVEFDVITSNGSYSLSIVVYRNDEKVKSSSTTSSLTTGDTLHLNLTYALGEESSSDTSSD